MQGSQNSSNTDGTRGLSIRAMVRRFREDPPRPREVRDLEAGHLWGPLGSEADSGDSHVGSLRQVASTSKFQHNMQVLICWVIG